MRSITSFLTGVLSIWMCVILGAKVACPYLTVIALQWKKRRKEEQGGAVWGVSKDQSVKLAVFPWTPGGSGVPACFWE